MKGGGTNERTNERTDEQKSPCVLQDFVPFRAAAQKHRFLVFLGHKELMIGAKCIYVPHIDLTMLALLNLQQI